MRTLLLFALSVLPMWGQDVKAIRDQGRWVSDPKMCPAGVSMTTNPAIWACAPEHEWTCADPHAALMTSVDGSQHWCHKMQSAQVCGVYVYNTKTGQGYCKSDATPSQEGSDAHEEVERQQARNHNRRSISAVTGDHRAETSDKTAVSNYCCALPYAGECGFEALRLCSKRVETWVHTWDMP